ncbi:MAG TPA: hypothetical protein VN310_15430 [Candidatus Dormibacteraeota bacterium]|nr:hypothetical protein [Candidatus Dormibacteraeota bacterium]
MSIKMLAMAITAFAFSLVLSGCDNFQAKPVRPMKQPYQRFIPVPPQPENLQGVPWSGALALDTKTGQLCQTYPHEFVPSNNSPSPLPSSPPAKTAEELIQKYNAESQQALGWHDIPLCKHLFESLPD